MLPQGRSEGTLIGLSVESPRPGTGGGLRPVLCSVALLCLPRDAGCSILRTIHFRFCTCTCFLELLVLFLLFLSVTPAARVFTVADHGAFPKTELWPGAICDAGELASSATFAMKACAQGSVKLEGKLRGSLSRQNANLRDPRSSLPLPFRTADSCDYRSRCLIILGAGLFQWDGGC